MPRGTEIPMPALAPGVRGGEWGWGGRVVGGALEGEVDVVDVDEGEMVVGMLFGGVVGVAREF